MYLTWVMVGVVAGIILLRLSKSHRSRTLSIWWELVILAILFIGALADNQQRASGSFGSVLLSVVLGAVISIAFLVIVPHIINRKLETMIGSAETEMEQRHFAAAVESVMSDVLRERGFPRSRDALQSFKVEVWRRLSKGKKTPVLLRDVVSVINRSPLMHEERGPNRPREI